MDRRSPTYDSESDGRLSKAFKTLYNSFREKVGLPHHGNLLRISNLSIVPYVSRFRTSKILIPRPSLSLKHHL